MKLNLDEIVRLIEMLNKYGEVKVGLKRENK